MTKVNTINYHIKKIFEDSIIRNFRITATDGKSYNINLESGELL